MLVAWGGGPLLCRMATRREELLAWPPPGARGIVTEYKAPLNQKAAQA